MLQLLKKLKVFFIVVFQALFGVKGRVWFKDAHKRWELYKIRTIKEKKEIFQIIKIFEILEAVYIVIFKNINSELNRGNKAKLIAVYGGEL